MTPDTARSAFVRAACVPREAGHRSGTLDEAQALLAAHPEIAASDVHTAAILGDAAGVRRFLAADSEQAIATADPYGWDALTHLCFSRYLRLDATRAAGFVSAAEALLEAGASANGGWIEQAHEPTPTWESVLYGAAGIAHHESLTRLLLAHGADPNDDETVYHTPEGYDNAALQALIETGKLTADSLAAMLVRKCDWHDIDGVRLLLAHGADANRVTRWGRSPLVHALLRDNDLAIIEALLDHGADPTVRTNGSSGASLAARRGRGDVLKLLRSRGVSPGLSSLDRLIAACAEPDGDEVRTLVTAHPDLIEQVVALGGQLLAAFAGVGNADGVRHLLDLGVPVDAEYGGDGYYGVAPHSTALHVAAWRARHATVKLLVERGARLDARDGQGRTALALAVKACTDSYWIELRSPESVTTLVRAGASTRGIQLPTGYDEIDAVLVPAGGRHDASERR